MKTIALALSALLVTSAAQAATKPPLSPQEQLAKAIEGRVAGKPVNCIDFRSIRSSRIIDKTAILYDTGTTLYVNTPVSGAEWLDRDDIMVTSTSLSQLCNVDIVRLVDQGTRMQSGSVGLGKFVPYTKPKR